MTMTTQAPARPAGIITRSFFAILRRDIVVTKRDVVPFLAQVLIQPFLTLFIFGVVLSGIGYVDSGKLTPVLLPGVVCLNAFLISLQNTAMPLVLEFSWSAEIEDRLLAPLPVGLLAVEKMVFGAMRGIFAAVLMIPIGFLMLDVSWPASGLLPALGVIVLTSLVGAAVGMTIGTLVPPRHINAMFAVVLAPITFTGATQFPWAALHGQLWFKIICAINPLTFGSEGLRDILIHGFVQSIPLWIDILVLIGEIAIFTVIGIRGFVSRSIN